MALKGEEEGGMENEYWIRERHWRAVFHRLCWSCRSSIEGSLMLTLLTLTQKVSCNVR